MQRGEGEISRRRGERRGGEERGQEGSWGGVEPACWPFRSSAQAGRAQRPAAPCRSRPRGGRVGRARCRCSQPARRDPPGGPRETTRGSPGGPPGGPPRGPPAPPRGCRGPASVGLAHVRCWGQVYSLIPAANMRHGHRPRGQALAHMLYMPGIFGDNTYLEYPGNTATPQVGMLRFYKALRGSSF